MIVIGDDGAGIATTRLIAAAASLDPVGRALLNLWIRRGLSDAQLAHLAGLTPGAVTNRKLDIVEHLSTALGLPPYEIVAALGRITRSPRPSSPAPLAPVPLPPAPQPRAPQPPPLASVPLPPAPQPRAPQPPAGPSQAPADPIVLPPLPELRLRRGARSLAGSFGWIEVSLPPPGDAENGSHAENGSRSALRALNPAAMKGGRAAQS
jgi:hypothetical protein